MREAFWNGLFDVRWKDVPLGLDAIRLVLWLRNRGYLLEFSRQRGATLGATAWNHISFPSPTSTADWIYVVMGVEI